MDHENACFTRSIAGCNGKLCMLRPEQHILWHVVQKVRSVIEVRRSRPAPQLEGIRFSDVERARCHYPLHQSRADAERLANLHYARVEAPDALFQVSPAHAPALFICTPLAVRLVG